MNTQNSVSIRWMVDHRKAEVFVPHVEITRDRSVDFHVRIKKLPLPKIPTRGKFFIHTVCVDPESTCLSRLIKEAKRLRDLAEEEKVAILLGMVRGVLQYPFPSLIERLERENPVDANWIKDHVTGTPYTLFSEYIERGYGECRHYAVLFAVLAQAAGLEVILAWCLEKTLVNFIRQDTNEPLFVTVPLGVVNTGHGWNEVRTQDGSWIPVDPTKDINGFNPTEREIFKKANYSHLLSGVIQIQIEGIDERRRAITIPNLFGSGQGEVDGLLRIGLNTSPRLVVKPGGKSEWVPRDDVLPHYGPLRFTIESACIYDDKFCNVLCADAEILKLELA